MGCVPRATGSEKKITNFAVVGKPFGGCSPAVYSVFWLKEKSSIFISTSLRFSPPTIHVSETPVCELKTPLPLQSTFPASIVSFGLSSGGK
jgi:hypothetical protein